MANITIAGLELLADSESFLNDITDEMSVVGGFTVNDYSSESNNNAYQSNNNANININSSFRVS